MGRRLPSHLSPLLALPLLSALSCADPAAPLDTADRNVVAAVISGGDPTDLGLAPYAGLISATFTQAGTIPGGARMQGAVTDPGMMPAAPNRMSAVALELTYDVTGPDSQRYTGTVTEILAWRGADSMTHLPAEMFSAGAWSFKGTPIGNGLYDMSTLDDPDGFAYYAKPPAPALGLAIGTFQLTADRFDTATVSCGAQGNVQCQYSSGTVNATFHFRVEDPASANAYVQPGTVVDGLPAVRVRLASR